jgi:hypothetical protein
VQTPVREAVPAGSDLSTLGRLGQTVGLVDEVERAEQYRGTIVRDEHAVALHRQIGELVDLPAWLARVRRI